MELRFLSNVQVRSSGANKIEGYAAVFNSQSKDLGGFREILKPGCFARAIRTGQDVRCLFNHDYNSVLGRTKSGTLRLSEDSTGLQFDCALGDSPVACNVRDMVSRGDVDGCSFAFIVPKGGDAWEVSDSRTIRRIADVDLFDVGPVTYPAYGATSVSARKFLPQLWPQGAPVEVRSHLRGTGLVSACYRFPELDGEIETLRAQARLRMAMLQF